MLVITELCKSIQHITSNFFQIPQEDMHPFTNITHQEICSEEII